MSRRTVFKIAIDCMMTLLLLLLMAYSLVGETLHEWLGAGMLLLFILHHGFNAACDDERHTPHDELPAIKNL